MDTSDSSDDDSAYSGGPVRMMIGPRRRAPPERRPFAAATRRDYFALWVLARHTRLPADAVKVVFRDFLDCGATLDLTFPDVEDDDARANVRNAFQCLVWSFVRQPEVSVLHLPSKTVFRPLRFRTRAEHAPPLFTSRAPGMPVPGFMGAEVPDVYEDLVKRTSPTCILREATQIAMVDAVRNAATVRVADGADGAADPWPHKGGSTSLQRECSARARSGNSIHASRALREMIARPKISRNEWKTAEIGAFEA